jgi:hypothetical protein
VTGGVHIESERIENKKLRDLSGFRREELEGKYCACTTSTYTANAIKKRGKMRIPFPH